MERFISHSEDETLAFSKKIANYLQKGDIVILSGDLGSGKTKFTEGILSYYGLESEISSPTFTIVNEYITNNISIFHFDVYRLNDSNEFYAIGGEEYFYKGICIIEWGELLEDILPKEYLKIIFSRDLNNENFRILDFKTYGKRFDNLIKKLFYEIKEEK